MVLFDQRVYSWVGVITHETDLLDTYKRFPDLFDPDADRSWKPSVEDIQRKKEAIKMCREALFFESETSEKIEQIVAKLQRDAEDCVW